LAIFRISFGFPKEVLEIGLTKSVLRAAEARWVPKGGALLSQIHLRKRFLSRKIQFCRAKTTKFAKNFRANPANGAQKITRRHRHCAFGKSTILAAREKLICHQKRKVKAEQTQRSVQKSEPGSFQKKRENINIYILSFFLKGTWFGFLHISLRLLGRKAFFLRANQFFSGGGIFLLGPLRSLGGEAGRAAT